LRHVTHRTNAIGSALCISFDARRHEKWQTSVHRTSSSSSVTTSASPTSAATAMMSKAYLIMAAQGLVAQFLETFKEFPPRQHAASFTIDQAMESMERSISGAGR
jgi:hypothetical protein